jgi:glyceraldehyde-3-phosphate dehydrogenase/erythrose-4-phosphate dehydrogenase
MADLVVKVKKKSNKEVLLQILEEAAQGTMKNILAVNHEPLVSSDFRGRSHSCIVDAEFSEVSENIIKLVLWHDNEHAYSSRIIALAQYITDAYKKDIITNENQM